MPEYLAPGVYVEETSFRARSIEGVSTSTTGFAGPTRRGPIDGTPELITSLGDFERVYGGGAGLDFAGTASVNHLAHAVRAYFDNGGRRLYVSRVYLENGGDGRAVQSTPGPFISGTAGDPEAQRARFVSRQAGSGGNSRIELFLRLTPVTKRTLDGAPIGSLARFGGTAAEGATLTGGAGPYFLNDGDQLRLEVGGAAVDITFSGQAAEATGGVDLPANIDLEEANRELTVTVGGRAQALRLPVDPMTPEELVAAVNAGLRGGYARLDGARLVVGTDVRGSSASITLGAHPVLSGGADVASANAADAQNNVADLAAVSAAEIDALLPATVTASGSPLVLRTQATGAAASLTVLAGTAAAFGLADGATDAGEDGAATRDYVKTADGWRDSSDNPPAGFDALASTATPAGGADLLSFNLSATDGDGGVKVYEELGFDRRHPRFVGAVLAAEPSRALDRLENVVAFEAGAEVTAFQIRGGLFPSGATAQVGLTGGSDGLEPHQAAYGTALDRLRSIEDISIVAAPGSSARADADGIRGALITHASQRRAYRIAVLDAPPDQLTGGALSDRGKFDSTRAAYYYPWVVVSNPAARPGDESIPRELTLPPSGFVCGIYARNDNDRGVHKAPANEVVRGALRFGTDVNFAEQEVLNPAGVNCMRTFPRRGRRLWGARTASSDPEFKYVSDRRYFLYLEHSIDRGTQWAVFEPNGHRLWANVRETIESFLYAEWKAGALFGTSPKEAFFVRCDRSTMTQNDLDNGRLICEIGVAILRPAEFVIFRIGQKTADARG